MDEHQVRQLIREVVAEVLREQDRRQRLKRDRVTTRGAA